jgi:hypothetical protein
MIISSLYTKYAITFKTYLQRSNLMKIKVLLFLFIFSSCTEKKVDFCNAIVHEAHYSHWGRGYYKLKVSYSFYVDNILYSGRGNAEGLMRPTGNWKPCEPGDTIIIKYKKNNPKYNNFHSTIKRVKLWNKHGEYNVMTDSVVRVIKRK